MIEVTDLLLCDFAEVTPFGTLNARAIRREIFLNEFSNAEGKISAIPAVFVAAHFEGDLSDLGTTFTYGFRAVGPDGEDIASPPVDTEQLPAVLPEGRIVHKWHFIEIDPFPTPIPGDYVFEVLLNGALARSVRLRVGRAPAAG